jgi:hypothetical protein
MRSTRATAAVARLNQRSEGLRYGVVITSSGLFKLQAQTGEGEKQTSEALSLDDFVRFVEATGPQKINRITKNDAAFSKQLVRKVKP